MTIPISPFSSSFHTPLKQYMKHNKKKLEALAVTWPAKGESLILDEDKRKLSQKLQIFPLKIKTISRNQYQILKEP